MSSIPLDSSLLWNAETHLCISRQPKYKYVVYYPWILSRNITLSMIVRQDYIHTTEAVRLSGIPVNNVRAASLSNLSQRCIVGCPRISIRKWPAFRASELRDNQPAYLLCKLKSVIHVLSGIRYHFHMALVSIQHNISRVRVSKASHSWNTALLGVCLVINTHKPLGSVSQSPYRYEYVEALCSPCKIVTRWKYSLGTKNVTYYRRRFQNNWKYAILRHNGTGVT